MPTVRNLLHAARDLVMAGDYGRAREICEHILAHYPKHGAAYVVLGESLREAGHLTRARDAFLRALATDPENGICYWALGLIAEQRGDREHALALLERALDYLYGDPDLGRAIRQMRAGDRPYLGQGGLCRLYLRQGMFGRAVREFSAALQVEPSRLDLRLGLAETLWRMGRFDQARTECKQIVARAPDCVKALLILADCAHHGDHPDDATEYLNRASAADLDGDIAAALFVDADPLWTGRAPIEIEDVGEQRASARPVVPAYDQQEASVETSFEASRVTVSTGSASTQDDATVTGDGSAATTDSTADATDSDDWPTINIVSFAEDTDFNQPGDDPHEESLPEEVLQIDDEPAPDDVASIVPELAEESELDESRASLSPVIEEDDDRLERDESGLTSADSQVEGTDTAASLPSENEPSPPPISPKITSSSAPFDGVLWPSTTDALNEHADPHQTRLEEAKRHQQVGELDEAVTDYVDLIRHAPELTTEVIDNLRWLVYAHPDHAGAHRALGDAYMRLGRFQEAIDEYNWVYSNKRSLLDRPGERG